MNRSRLCASAAGIAAILLAVVYVPAPAVAATPQRGYFDFPESGTDPAGTTCSFPVDFTQDEYGFYDVFVDQDGNIVDVLIHTSYDATIRANGYTLTERDTFTRTVYADGTMRDAGMTVHIQGPGNPAVIMRDAGQIVYSDTNETVEYVNGPHPQLFGASFCSALGG
jgi:hypothetical protein